VEESIEGFKKIGKDTNKMLDEMGISGAEMTLMMFFLFGLMLGVIPSAIIIGWYRIPPLFGLDSVFFSIIGAIVGLGLGVMLTRTLNYIADRIMRKDLNVNNAEFDTLLNKATQGDAEAQYDLANLYFNGKQDYEEAIKWLTMVANQGSAKAQKGLAGQYLEGEKIPKDIEQAIKWFTFAAEQGDIEAQIVLAGIYLNDEAELVPQNIEEGMKWLTLAANQGDAEAQYYLGVMYKVGEFVPQNKKEAIKWITLAANREYSDAKELLEKIL
jgi:hypothetical protein